MNDSVKYIARLLRWAFLALGAGQLALVLKGPIPFVVANACVAIVFVFFVARVERLRAFNAIAGLVLMVSLVLAIMTSLYFYTVLLEVTEQVMVLGVVGVSSFGVAGIFTVPFIRTKHVAQ